MGYDKRTFKIFVADVSKQVCQQMIGGILMALFAGLMTSQGFDALSWYGAEFPFEILFTTALTSVFKSLSERLARVRATDSPAIISHILY